MGDRGWRLKAPYFERFRYYRQKMEAQLTRLDRSAETTGIRTNLCYVTRLFREHIAMLDESIKTVQQGRKNTNLSA